MSYVTTVTIITNEFSSHLEEQIEKINQYFTEKEKLGVPFKDLNIDGAGTKSHQRSFLIGGINYLNHEEFIQFFKSLKMRDTLLILAPENGESYEIVASDTILEIKE